MIVTLLKNYWLKTAASPTMGGLMEEHQELIEGMEQLARLFPSKRAEELLSDELQVLVSDLISYRKLLLKWQETYHILGSSSVEELNALHLVDSLSGGFFLLHHWENHLQGSGAEPTSMNILDIGSGLGLPGIPLSLMLRNARIFLVEASRKRSNLLQNMVWELGLRDRVEVVAQELGVWKMPQISDLIVTCRAFKTLDRKSLHLLTKPFREMAAQINSDALSGILLYKGQEPAAREELTALNLIAELRSFPLPLTQRERSLVWLEATQLAR